MFKHTTWMAVAEVIASESKAERLQVGAVVVKNDRVISSGINGTPRGWDNKCEDEDGKTKSEVIHGEANALIFAARNGLSTDGASIYITVSPCASCAGLISQSGINHVFYRHQYRDRTGIDLLQKAGITVEKL